MQFWMVNKQNSLPGSPSDYLNNNNRDKVHQSTNTPSGITGAPVSRLDAHTATGLHPVKPQYAVEFDTSRGAGKVWINIVDKATGKVVFKIPPELVRQWTNQSQIPKGANVDLRS